MTDTEFFLGPGNDPSAVSFDATWTAMEEARHLSPDCSDPNLGHLFAGESRLAMATASFSGSHWDGGFRFQVPTASSEGIFAEMGMERTGFFLREADQISAARSGRLDTNPRVRLPNPAWRVSGLSAWKSLTRRR